MNEIILHRNFDCAVISASFISRSHILRAPRCVCRYCAPARHISRSRDRTPIYGFPVHHYCGSGRGTGHRWGVSAGVLLDHLAFDTSHRTGHSDGLVRTGTCWEWELSSLPVVELYRLKRDWRACSVIGIQSIFYKVSYRVCNWRLTELKRWGKSWEGYWRDYVQLLTWYQWGWLSQLQETEGTLLMVC